MTSLGSGHLLIRGPALLLLPDCLQRHDALLVIEQFEGVAMAFQHPGQVARFGRGEIARSMVTDCNSQKLAGVLAIHKGPSIKARGMISHSPRISQIIWRLD